MRCALALLSALLPLASQAALFESPVAGWRDSRVQQSESQAVAAYPKPPVDRGAQAGRTLIQGKLRQSGGKRRPATLVVNGTPMPLYTDAEGHYARPWAFASGSNSIEVRSADGERQRVQFFEAHAGKAGARLRLVLTWDDPQAEVDMHVLTPAGGHAWWGRPQLEEGGGLDVDSVDGAGPEIFSSAAPARGAWLVYVNYWGNFDDAGYNFDESRRQRDLIVCRLTVIRNENTADEQRETWEVPLRKVGELTLLRRLLW